MDWDLVLKVAAGLIAIVGVIIQWRILRSFRANLKADLDILKLYQETTNEPAVRALIESRIRHSIQRAYRPKTPAHYTGVFLSTVSIVVTVVWLYSFLSHGLTPGLAWSLLVLFGIYALSFWLSRH